MILSSNRELGEFDTIRLSAHIEQVWKEIESALPKYWQAFIDREAAKQPVAKLSAHFGGQAKTPSTGSLVTQAFAIAVQQYEKTAAKYRGFFDPEAMEEFADDPGAFKGHLAKEVPVIAGTLNQRRPELQEWQRDFRAARGKDLLEVFSNVTTQAPTVCDGMAYWALAIFSRTGRRAWCWRVPGRTRPGRTLRRSSRSVRRVRGGWDWLT